MVAPGAREAVSRNPEAKRAPGLRTTSRAAQKGEAGCRARGKRERMRLLDRAAGGNRTVVVVLRFDDVIGLWREGQRRLADADPPLRAAFERVTDAIVDELRRRLGGSFTTDELARYYLEHGIDWCFDIAVRAAPGVPEAWDISTVANAAFARYVRAASDWAGGGRIVRRD